MNGWVWIWVWCYFGINHPGWDIRIILVWERQNRVRPTFISFSFFFLYGILMEFLINLPQGASCTSPQGRDLPRFRVDECCTTFVYKWRRVSGLHCGWLHAPNTHRAPPGGHCETPRNVFARHFPFSIGWATEVATPIRLYHRDKNSQKSNLNDVNKIAVLLRVKSSSSAREARTLCLPSLILSLSLCVVAN